VSNDVILLKSLLHGGMLFLRDFNGSARMPIISFEYYRGDRLGKMPQKRRRISPGNFSLESPSSSRKRMSKLLTRNDHPANVPSAFPNLSIKPLARASSPNETRSDRAPPPLLSFAPHAARGVARPIIAPTRAAECATLRYVTLRGMKGGRGIRSPILACARTFADDRFELD